MYCWRACKRPERAAHPVVPPGFDRAGSLRCVGVGFEEGRSYSSEVTPSFKLTSTIMMSLAATFAVYTCNSAPKPASRSSLWATRAASASRVRTRAARSVLECLT
jgi:hypothetical protein